MAILVDEESYKKILYSVNSRAEEITENNDELRTLFEIRQAFGPAPEKNTGEEILEFEFEKVSRDRAKEILKESDDENLRFIGKRL